jgi:hypothetical protein
MAGSTCAITVQQANSELLDLPTQASVEQRHSGRPAEFWLQCEDASLDLRLYAGVRCRSLTFMT